MICKNVSLAGNLTDVITEVFLGLGSNLEDPKKQIQSGLASLGDLLIKLKSAHLYLSKPLGPQNQPQFINTVAKGLTKLSPQDLLKQCQQIEQDHYRIRIERWGPRTLDIDILYFGEMRINSEELTIPHPEIFNRDFVVIPLLELIPSGVTPIGDRIDLTRYDLSSLRKIEQTG